MLRSRQAERGVNLVELMVTLSVFAFLVAMAGPSFGTWLQNSRIRNTAESLLAGLQLAKAEAVARNARVRFQLTSTLDSSCVLTTSAANWVVNVDPDANTDEVAGKCDATPDEDDAPRILQARPASDGSGNSVVDATVPSVVFNGLGRLTTPAMAIDITNPAGGDCAADGGEMTCLRVLVTPGGQLRMCNPLFDAATDPQGC
jgi:type IV fimbrial biogenesis protein FimT